MLKAAVLSAMPRMKKREDAHSRCRAGTLSRDAGERSGCAGTLGASWDTLSRDAGVRRDYQRRGRLKQGRRLNLSGQASRDPLPSLLLLDVEQSSRS